MQELLENRSLRDINTRYSSIGGKSFWEREGNVKDTQFWYSYYILMKKKEKEKLLLAGFKVFIAFIAFTLI